jgi:Secretion system C-terminal sorting domain
VQLRISIRLILIAALLPGALCRGQNYEFFGKMPRAVLNSYLAKSLALEFDSLHRGMKAYNDLIDFAARTNARYLSRCYGFGYGKVLPINYGILDSFSHITQDIRTAYSALGQTPPVVEAAIFEVVTSDLDSILMSDEVVNAYHVPKRRFIFDSIKYADDTSTVSAVPDISRPETQMYFYFLATSLLKAGAEALHMGQIDLESKNDPKHLAVWNLLSKIRTYAANCNRGLVLINADAVSLHVGATDTALYDFCASPCRVTGYYTGTDSTWTSMWNYEQSEYGGPGILAANACSPYGKTGGGYSPMGWYADTLPCLVRLDNYEANNCNCLAQASCWNTYGYDEISWFALQAPAYRDAWLCYAYSRVKQLDAQTFFEMPGRTLLTLSWEYYNAVNGYRFNQEDAISNIWNRPDTACNPNLETELHRLWGSADSQQVNVVVYPNPVNGTAHIVYNSTEGDEVNICIFDLAGKKIEEWQPRNNGGNLLWQTGNLQAGSYRCTAFSRKWTSKSFRIDVMR